MPAVHGGAIKVMKNRKGWTATVSRSSLPELPLATMLPSLTLLNPPTVPHTHAFTDFLLKFDFKATSKLRPPRLATSELSCTVV